MLSVFQKTEDKMHRSVEMFRVNFPTHPSIYV
jgi:hypothetical protein